jgi:EAL domain-containing protein (putative c-di-GMP-specific phosphodiesterase class I)
MRPKAPDANAPVTAPPITSSDPIAPPPPQYARTLFQPQISTHSGAISGISVVPRFHIDTQFSSGMSDLEKGSASHCKVDILTDTLRALRILHKSSPTPFVINYKLSTAELEDPRFTAKLEWELERFDLHPSSLRLVLPSQHCKHPPQQTTVSVSNDLKAMGCSLAINGFASGPHCVEIVEKCGVELAIIEPTLTMGVDRNTNRRRIFSTVIAMAQDLDIETLACNVRTAGEHTLLSQLGCDHVQGDGIVSPMPLDETAAWVRIHLEKLAHLHSVGSGIY